MKNNRLWATIFILLGVVYALSALFGNISNQMVWLAAVIFLGLGIYRLSKGSRR